MLKRKGRFYVCSKLIEDSPETVLLASIAERLA